MSAKRVMGFWEKMVYVGVLVLFISFFLTLIFVPKYVNADPVAQLNCCRPGPPGPPGPQGPMGPPGNDGSNGSDGINGRSGSDGSDGSNGRRGSDGSNGLDGQDGSNSFALRDSCPSCFNDHIDMAVSVGAAIPDLVLLPGKKKAVFIGFAESNGMVSVGMSTVIDLNGSWVVTFGASTNLSDSCGGACVNRYETLEYHVAKAAIGWQF